MRNSPGSRSGAPAARPPWRRIRRPSPGWRSHRRGGIESPRGVCDPGRPSSPSIRVSPDLRRSRSTSVILRPACASATARLMATEVDPSSRWAPATIMVRACALPRKNSTLPGAHGTLGLGALASGEGVAGGAPARRGTKAGEQRQPTAVATSAGDAKRPSSASHSNASPIPRNVPSTTASSRFRARRGSTCEAEAAGSTTGAGRPQRLERAQLHMPRREERAQCGPVMRPGIRDLVLDHGDGRLELRRIESVAVERVLVRILIRESAREGWFGVADAERDNVRARIGGGSASVGGVRARVGGDGRGTQQVARRLAGDRDLREHFRGDGGRVRSLELRRDRAGARDNPGRGLVNALLAKRLHEGRWRGPKRSRAERRTCVSPELARNAARPRSVCPPGSIVSAEVDRCVGNPPHSSYAATTRRGL